jgi:hypothetical protein
VGDGLPLGELKSDPDVIDAFGGVAAVEALPSERGIRPVEFYDVSSPRTAKTMRAVCRAIVASQTVDLSSLKVGEVPRVSILSLKLDISDVPFRLLVGCLQGSAVLRALIVKIGSDSVEVRHPSGRTVEIAVVAGGRAAGGLVARWSAGLIADEGTRMVGADDGVANLPEAMSAIRERLLPGAQIQVVGQPHAPFGPAHEAFQQYHGHPTDEVVAMKTTGPAGNPSFWTRKRLDKLRRRDASAADVAEFAKFLSPDSSLFDSTALDAVTRASVSDLPFRDYRSYSAAMDPGTRGNSWTFVLVEIDVSAVPHKFAVAAAREWTGTKDKPLVPGVVLTEIAKICRRYGVIEVVSDQWGFDFMRADAFDLGIRLRQRNLSTLERVEFYEETRSLIEDKRLELAPIAHLREDLLRVKKKVTQTGVAIELPRTSDGRHCDFAPSLVLAVHETARHSRRSMHTGCVAVANIRERFSDGSYAAAANSYARAPLSRPQLEQSYRASVEIRRDALLNEDK